MAISAIFVVGSYILVAGEPDSVVDGVFTLEQARRGAAFFPVKCPRCHGTDLLGDGFETPALIGSDFVRRWSGLTVADLYLFISQYMPKDQPGSLEPQTYADLVALILRYNGYPTGDAELPPDAKKLVKIQFEPK